MRTDRRILKQGALLFVLLLAFALRVSGLTAQSMWRDEIDALEFSQASLPTLVGYFVRPGWNGPLFYVFLRPWVALAGRSEFGLRYFSLWFSVLGVALLYRLGRAWFSPPAGALAALLSAVSAYMVWYAQELKMYALVCTLVLVVLYVYRLAIQRADWRLWVAVIILTWVTAGVHIMGALLVPVLVLLFVVWWPRSRSQWKVALVALAGVALPGLVAGPWALPTLLHGGNIGHHFVPLGSMARILLSAFSQGITNFGGDWALVVVVYGMLAGTLLRSGSDQARPVMTAWVWLATPVLGLYAISLRVPMFVDRYLIWIGPAIYVLVARGIVQLRRRSALLGVVYLILVLGLNGWGVWKQLGEPIKSDFRAAAAFVRQRRRPDELALFHISYVRKTFEYYYGDAAPWADGIPTDEQTRESAVDAEMRAHTAGYETVWLVLSEPEMWDRRGMTVDWLTRHAQLVSRADFARVSVRQYRLSAPRSP